MPRIENDKKCHHPKWNCPKVLFFSALTVNCLCSERGSKSVGECWWFLIQRHWLLPNQSDSHEKYHLIFIEKYVQRLFIEQTSLEVAHLYAMHYILIRKRGRTRDSFAFFPLKLFRYFFGSGEIESLKANIGNGERNYGGYLTFSYLFHFLWFFFAGFYDGLIFFWPATKKIISRQSCRSSIFISSYCPKITEIVIPKKIVPCYKLYGVYRLRPRKKVRSVFGY